MSILLGNDRKNGGKGGEGEEGSAKFSSLRVLYSLTDRLRRGVGWGTPQEGTGSKLENSCS